MEKEANMSDHDISDGDLVRPIYEHGRYVNPFDTWVDSSFYQVLQFHTSKDNSNIPNKQELDKTLPIVVPDYDKLANPPRDNLQIMWVGHASLLVQMDGITLLTDPVFSNRCGPLSWFGPKRFRKPPCKVTDLPPIDAVLISHNHYDHLDYNSVRDLTRQFGDAITWYVPEGQGDWMRGAGCSHVVELSWWQESRLQKNGTSYMFASTPCQHWCRRGVNDANKALWCSWVVKGPNQSLYFAGDTGYCSAFKQIGQKYGPFTLSAIPIGAYEPRWFLKPQHVNTEEALRVHEEIRSKQSVGIHWGTFKLTTEPYLEPKQKLIALLKEKNLPTNTFITVNHGEVVIPDEITE